MLKRIILKKGEEVRILAGHPWVFDNEVAQIAAGKGAAQRDTVLEAGEIADVESFRKEYLGRAFVNPASKIIARIYSSSKEGVDTGFFKKRIRNALTGRSLYNLNTESCRIVFAEADFLPGLIIDRFTGWPAKKVFEIFEAAELNGENTRKKITFDILCEKLGSPEHWLSIQFLSFGMDIRRDQIIEALAEVLGGHSGIVEKSAPVREKEGLPLYDRTISGSFPDEGIIIFENGFAFLLNLLAGQKTGHFLDQARNRKHGGVWASELNKNLNRKIKVLDAFCYTGGFSVDIAASCAAEITSVDVSAPALKTLRINAELNGVTEKIRCTEANVFDFLTKEVHAKAGYDMIILDPPAFTKSRSTLDDAIRGYKEINLKAIKLLNPGGILITCSCSFALSESRFKAMIADAAFDAERRLTQVDFCYQPEDHPILIGYDESLYLKCGIYRVQK
ncbi:SAM-dependent methyltransferase [Spirochaetia bacterium]|nr:SAM-dependent methyltransferase [Spirochaetia bacterium]